MTTNLTKEEVPYSGEVYCVTVPTGFIVVRRNGKVSVTGNSAARDDTYGLILAGDDKSKAKADKVPKVRSVFMAPPGYFVVNADLRGAEIAIAGLLSNCQLLMDQVVRNLLPEDHPDYLDLHADLAARSFNLTCSLAEVKKNYKPLRTAAKRTRFGHYYGASPDTLLMKIWEEDGGQAVKIEDVIAIVKGHDQAYPELARTFAACRERPGKYGWMCDPFGAYRRFPKVRDRDLQGKQEREAQNALCQIPVASAINTALANVRRERKRLNLQFRIILSVHDSIALEVPEREVAFVVDKLLPYCMCDAVPVVPCDLNGLPIPGRKPYHFGIEVEVGRRFEEWMKPEEWREICKTAGG